MPVFKTTTCSTYLLSVNKKQGGTYELCGSSHKTRLQYNIYTKTWIQTLCNNNCVTQNLMFFKEKGYFSLCDWHKRASTYLKSIHISEISQLFCLESTTDGKLTVLKILEPYTQQVGHTIPKLVQTVSVLVYYEPQWMKGFSKWRSEEEGHSLIRMPVDYERRIM